MVLVVLVVLLGLASCVLFPPTPVEVRRWDLRAARELQISC